MAKQTQISYQNPKERKQFSSANQKKHDKRSSRKRSKQDAQGLIHEYYLLKESEDE